MLLPYYGLFIYNRKHAVTAAFSNSYGYDQDGIQTSRTIGGTTSTFTYDYENRLTAISGGSTSASFVYDADGNRVKSTISTTTTVTTVYIAGIYEFIEAGATDKVTKYYAPRGSRTRSVVAAMGWMMASSIPCATI